MKFIPPTFSGCATRETLDALSKEKLIEIVMMQERDAVTYACALSIIGSQASDKFIATYARAALASRSMAARRGE